MPAENRSVSLSTSLLLIFTLWTASACAEPGAGITEVQGTIGYSNFLDEGPLHHLVTGGSSRFYITKRIAIEPEFLFMYRSQRDIDFQVIPNVVFESRGASLDFNRTPLEVWDSNGIVN